MEALNLKDLKLTTNESKDIIKFIAKKRSTTTKKILETINQNQNQNENENLTETQQKLIKTQQKLIKSQQLPKSHHKLTEKHIKLKEKHIKLTESQKSQQKIIKLQKSHKKKQITSQQKLIKSQQKLIKSRKLTKPIKTKPQQPSPKRIDDIRKKLNELKHNFPRSEFNKIRKNLYNLKNKNKFSKTSRNYLNDLNKKIINFNKHEDYVRLENVKDLYSILDYKPVLVRTGFNNYYLEYISEGDKSLSFIEYLNLINPYLEDLINNKKNKGEWKLQLTAQISFVSLKPDSDETRLMHTRSVGMEFMSGSETEETIQSRYRSLLQNYQDNLQEKMRGSDFVFNGINYLYYDFNRISISKGGSYIESPKWLKDKKSTINQKN